MKKLIIPLLVLAGYSYALPGIPDYTNLEQAQGHAKFLLNTCIYTGGVLDPITKSKCDGEFSGYIGNLSALNNGLPLIINHDGYISPLIWSIYDLCMFETGRFINQGTC